MQDTVLTVGNEGTQLCNIMQLSSLCRASFFFPLLSSFPWLPSQVYLAAGHGMLWDVGEEGAGDHVIQSRLCALQEGIYGGVCSLGTGLWALKFQTVSFCNKL